MNKEEKESPEEILNELEEKQETIKKENKQLKNILIGIIIVLLLILLGYWFINSVRNFKYNGVDFEVVKEGDLIFYNTKLPLYDTSGNYYNDYNFFLRKDPRKSNVEFNGTIKIKENMVLNADDNLNCEGYGVIAIVNLKNLYEALGTKVIRDENASCDNLSRYIYMEVKPGNETKIEEVSPACYNIYINNCEILEGTEKFMVETFAKAKQEREK